MKYLLVIYTMAGNVQTASLMETPYPTAEACLRDADRDDLGNAAAKVAQKKWGPNATVRLVCANVPDPKILARNLLAD